MQFALDIKGNKVYAEDADREISYVCPLCGETVILRRGEIKIPHFAHKSGHESCDGWHYDMSEWHLSKQNLFPAEYREVVVVKDGVKHRADVLINNIVIEFQHSPISAKEYKARNDFYSSCGYRVVWVFDMNEAVKNRQLIVSECISMIWQSCQWSRARGCFTATPKFEESFWYTTPPVIVYFSYKRYKEVLNRVVWWGYDKSKGSSSFKHLLIARNEIYYSWAASNPSILVAPFCTEEELRYERRRVEYSSYLAYSCFIDNSTVHVYINNPSVPMEWELCHKWLEKASLNSNHGCRTCKCCSEIIRLSVQGCNDVYRCTCSHPEEVRDSEEPLDIKDCR